MILEDPGFIRFVDNVSKLNVGDTVAWVRSTEDPFSFLNSWLANFGIIIMIILMINHSQLIFSITLARQHPSQ